MSDAALYFCLSPRCESGQDMLIAICAFGIKIISTSASTPCHAPRCPALRSRILHLHPPASTIPKKTTHSPRPTPAPPPKTPPTPPSRSSPVHSPSCATPAALLCAHSRSLFVPAQRRPRPRGAPVRATRPRRAPIGRDPRLAYRFLAGWMTGGRTGMDRGSCCRCRCRPTPREKKWGSH